VKALIIDEPWITKILDGKKTWEMRRTACHIRGQIGLIRKGSGKIVGVADLIDSEAPLGTLKEYAAAGGRHGIPSAGQAAAFTGGWRIPWVLANARRLARPVSYSHPSGAVIWVNLSPVIAKKVSAQIA
jgi:hypothetical protein